MGTVPALHTGTGTLIVDSSMESEAIGSSKAAEAVSFAREILRALGVPPQGSTLITTDNLSNQRVATGAGAPSRSLHFLRRYGVLKQRIRSGEVNVQHLESWGPTPKALTGAC